MPRVRFTKEHLELEVPDGTTILQQGDEIIAVVPHGAEEVLREMVTAASAVED